MKYSIKNKLLSFTFFFISLFFFLNFIVFLNLFNSLKQGGVVEEREELTISYVVKDSAADKAGILVGDIIDNIEGKKLSYNDFYGFVGKEIKNKLSISVRRNGELLDFNLENISNPEMIGGESGMIVTNKYLKKQNTFKISLNHMTGLLTTDDRPYFHPNKNVEDASSPIIIYSRRVVYLSLSVLFFYLGKKKLSSKK